ncbi:MAG TPA: DUF885 domain-containing protein [Gemmatimonadaceae bacterium]|nr:DUF885 domain-containing protein [Gemmatimonadaceae bacterium]
MSGTLDAILDGYLDLRWAMNPVEATFQGRHERDGEYAMWDAQSVKQHLAALKSYEGALEEVEPADLQDEIDRTAALQAVRHEILVLDKERPFERNPGLHLSHALSGIYLLLARVPADPAQRARAILARLRAMPALFERAEKALTRPDATFVSVARAMLPGGHALIARSLDDRSVDLTMLDPAELAGARQGAMESLAAFGAVLARMEETAGSTYAIGRDLFDRKLATWHLIKENADELYRYGERLRAEAKAELERLAGEIRPGASWRDVVAELRTDRPRREDALKEYAASMRRAREFTASHGLVKVPEGELRVIETPEFLRAMVPYAAYQGPGAFDESQLGTFFVTLPPPGEPWRSDCRAELPNTAVHEGYPGHHLQIVTGNGLPRRVRRVLATPAAREGWALYCETLMADEGFLEPPQRFFQAHHLLWRALRIVLDISLHTRGMTWQEASRIMQEELGFEAGLADAEAKRYCAYPTYQLCYAVGRREILRLREDARAARGGRFSLRGFHEELLSYGSYPIALARWGMGLSAA